MKKRTVLTGFLAVVLITTVLVSCYGHEKRADADPVAWSY